MYLFFERTQTFSHSSKWLLKRGILSLQRPKIVHDDLNFFPKRSYTFLRQKAHLHTRQS